MSTWLGPIVHVDQPLRIQVGGGPEPPKQREERSDDYYANVGDAIRTLREDVPDLFKSDLNCAIPRLRLRVSINLEICQLLPPSCHVSVLTRRSDAQLAHDCPYADPFDVSP